MYPAAGQPLRAAHMTLNTGTKEALSEATGMPHGAHALCTEAGTLYYANRYPRGSFSRAGSGRNPANSWQLAASGAGRFRPAGPVYNSRGSDSSALIVDTYEPGIIIDAVAANRLSLGPTAGSNYAPTGATGTRTPVTDPVMGSVMRLAKTGGSGNFGIFLGAGGLSGSCYSVACLVRPLTSVGQVVIYTDAVGLPSGLITASAAINMASLKLGEWNLIRYRGRVGGRTLAGGFSTFAWITDTGAVCDIGPYWVSHGDGFLQNVEGPGFAGEANAAEAPILVPVTPLDDASGAVVLRHTKATPTRDAAVGDGYTARVLWQARSGGDGWRLAVEADQRLTLTMTSGANTTAVSVLWSTLATGPLSLAASWSRAAGTLVLYANGAQIASAAGLTADKFPVTTPANILLGHSGAGAEALQGAVSWVAHYAMDPGVAELLAASASAEPRGLAVNWWDFRRLETPNIPPVPNNYIQSANTGAFWIPGPTSGAIDAPKKLGWF